MISSNSRPFPDQDSSLTGNSVRDQPISLATTRAAPASEWLAIAGFGPAAQAVLNRRLRPLLREAEIFGARLFGALYSCQALAEQTPEY